MKRILVLFAALSFSVASAFAERHLGDPTEYLKYPLSQRLTLVVKSISTEKLSALSRASNIKFDWKITSWTARGIVIIGLDKNGRELVSQKLDPSSLLKYYGLDVKWNLKTSDYRLYDIQGENFVSTKRVRDIISAANISNQDRSSARQNAASMALTLSTQ